MAPTAAHYRFVVHPQDDEGEHLVTFPALAAYGDSPAGAVVEAQAALASFVEIYDSARWPLPVSDAPGVLEDRFAPEQFSGRLVVRLPKSLHARLAERAADEGVSLDPFVLARLASRLVI